MLANGFNQQKFPFVKPQQDNKAKGRAGNETTGTMSMNLNANEPQAYDLDVFSLCFIIEYVCHISRKDLLTASACMDTDHRHSNRPRSIANCHLKVCIIRLHRQNVIHRQLVFNYKANDSPDETDGLNYMEYCPNKKESHIIMTVLANTVYLCDNAYTCSRNLCKQNKY